MNKLKKWHRYLGLGVALFTLFAIISGWALGHRAALAEIDLPRSILPPAYQYTNWNNASVRGTLRAPVLITDISTKTGTFVETSTAVLTYGTAGIWLTDTLASHFTPFMAGMRHGADNRIVSRIVCADNSLFAATTFHLYRCLSGATSWNEIDLPGHFDGERLTDVETRSDTLVVLSRSHLFISLPPYEHFVRITLAPPPDYKERTNLFSLLWVLHSGELFGRVGIWTVDVLGLLLAVLVITGVAFYFLPHLIRRRRKFGRPVKQSLTWLKYVLRLHNRSGAWLWIFFLLMALTGIFLRPPLLITIVRVSLPTPPGTMLADDNAWNDKLRTIRFDRITNEWLLYTSKGFYRLSMLKNTPIKIADAPPVSVMGANVLEAVDNGWIVGSFNGLYLWNTRTRVITNLYTNLPAIAPPPSRPVSEHPVSGYSDDFVNPIIFEYVAGATTRVEKVPDEESIFVSDFVFPPMPDEIANTHISLWHTALEVHTGRILFGILNPMADIYITLLGLTIIFLLMSGYRLYRRRKQHVAPK
ncbi:MULTISPECIES: PepSY domain-containing protein [Bacteroides]|uniref:PepSY domain-containing protein n=1 Tax=Bacteroides TaxID=816 RepID=UPI0004AD1F41|nr:PepSY domain-containing protein [Bacteroides neonati]